ncbi:hypothetical protein K0M31_008757, partial [Melipona bicolor]
GFSWIQYLTTKLSPMGTDDVCNERGQSNGALLQQLGNTMVYQGVASLPSTSTLTMSLGHRQEL